MKILILKPSSLGDVIQALPVLRLIKKHLPSASIYWWIEAGLAGLLEEDPDLAELVPFHRNGWGSFARWIRLGKDIAWMRRQQFDWVIDLQCLARSASFAWLANGGRTIGLDEPREGARCLYDTAVPRSRTSPHAVDWYLSVLPLLGIPKSDFVWIPPKTAAAAAIRRKWPVATRTWVIIQPGARWPTKCWPAESYAQVVRQLAAGDQRLSFAILGTARESGLACQITAAAPARCLDLTGQLTLPEMIEWIRASKLIIGNDTGPMHVAAALGKPLVAIFGPTDPRRTGPYGEQHGILQADLSCSPCFQKTCRNSHKLECLHAVTPPHVVRAATAALARQAFVPEA